MDTYRTKVSFFSALKDKQRVTNDETGGKWAEQQKQTKQKQEQEQEQKQKREQKQSRGKDTNDALLTVDHIQSTYSFGKGIGWSKVARFGLQSSK